MKKKPKISIISPVYNVSKFLDVFFDSIDRQDNDNYELIFINDGSSDNSLELLEKYSLLNDKVTIINKENEGSGASRNRGLEVAEGDYVFFCDPDDYLENNCLSIIEDVIGQANPDIVLFGYNIVNDKYDLINKRFNQSELVLNNMKEIINNFYTIYLENNINSVWNKVYRRTFLQDNALSFPTNRTAQDAIFNYEVLEFLETMLIIPDTLYNYLQLRSGSAQNIAQNKFYDEYVLLEKKIEVFNKWNINSLISISIIDFWSSQIISYKGLFSEEFTESTEFKGGRKMLKKLVKLSDLNIKNKIKYILYFLNLNRLSYFIFSKININD